MHTGSLKLCMHETLPSAFHTVLYEGPDPYFWEKGLISPSIVQWVEDSRSGLERLLDA